MDQGPFVAEQIETGAKFLAEFEKKTRASTVFWLRTGEEDTWYLYIASDEWNDTNRDVPYREVLRIAREFRDRKFDPFQVKVITLSHPLAKGAIDFQQQFSGKTAMRLRGRNFAGFRVDEAYIYPTPIAV